MKTRTLKPRAKRKGYKTTHCGNCGTLIKYLPEEVLPPRGPLETHYIVCGCGWLSGVVV